VTSPATASLPAVLGRTGGPGRAATKKATSPPHQGCARELKLWEQCGGKQGQCGAGAAGAVGASAPTCGDAQWAGACCPEGAECRRNDGYFWNCQPPVGWSGGSMKHVVPEPPVPFRLTASGEPAYADPLALSFLFYEAQRSGALGPRNRIPWRGDSGLADRGPGGRDVSGGWYDAGDNVKFNLPMAWTASVLAWSVHEFPDGYKAAKQYDTALDNIRWAADYLMRCVGDGREIVVQVGNGQQDHGESADGAAQACECSAGSGGP
jgi:hypothetical protein